MIIKMGGVSCLATSNHGYQEIKVTKLEHNRAATHASGFVIFLDPGSAV